MKNVIHFIYYYQMNLLVQYFEIIEDKRTENELYFI